MDCSAKWCPAVLAPPCSLGHLSPLMHLCLACYKGSCSFVEGILAWTALSVLSRCSGCAKQMKLDSRTLGKPCFHCACPANRKSCGDYSSSISLSGPEIEISCAHARWELQHPPTHSCQIEHYNCLASLNIEGPHQVKTTPLPWFPLHVCCCAGKYSLTCGMWYRNRCLPSRSSLWALFH